jgi:hypothetical protein
VGHLLPELAHPGDGKAAEDRHEQDLQQIPARECPDERAGNDIHQVGRDTLLGGSRDIARHRLGIEACGIDVESSTRLQHLAHEQTDAQRQGGYGFEIE